MKTYRIWAEKVSALKDLPLLFIRLALAYGYYGPATMKWKDIHSVGDWFVQLHIPAPYLSAYLVACTETVGVVWLILGLYVRYITIPLMFSMVVAIITVHWSNGFEASNNGFEIPLYYMLMLFVLLVFGAGRISIDSFLERKPR